MRCQHQRAVYHATQKQCSGSGVTAAALHANRTSAVDTLTPAGVAQRGVAHQKLRVAVDVDEGEHQEISAALAFVLLALMLSLLCTRHSSLLDILLALPSKVSNSQRACEMPSC
jgi:hypothetical protein